MSRGLLVACTFLYLNTWAEGQIDMCQSVVRTSSGDTLTHAQYPEYDTLTSCQCNMTSSEEDQGVQFTTNFHVLDSSYNCEPNIAFQNFQTNFLLYGCPSADSREVTIWLGRGQEMAISVINSLDLQARFNISFLVQGHNPVEVTCSPGLPGLVLPLALAAQQGVGGEPVETGHNDGAILAVVALVVILMIIFLAAYIKVRVRDHRLRKQRDRDRLDDLSQTTATTGPEDNNGYEPTPRSTPKSRIPDVARNGPSGLYQSPSYNQPQVIRRGPPPPSTEQAPPAYSSMPYREEPPYQQAPVEVERVNPAQTAPRSSAQPIEHQPILEPLYAPRPSGGMGRAPSQESIPGVISLSPAPSQQSIPSAMNRAPSQQSIPAVVSRTPSQQNIPLAMNRAPSQQSIPGVMNRAPSQQSIPGVMNRAPSQQSIPGVMNRAPSQQNLPGDLRRAPSQGSLHSTAALPPGPGPMRKAPSQSSMARAPSQTSIPQLLYPYPSPPDSPSSSHDGSINSSQFGNPAQRLAEYYTPPETTPDIRSQRASSMSPYAQPYIAKYSMTPDGETTV